ncbi:phage head closure protein [Paenibacillus lautus]|uniref:Head-tail adaptor protein n=1 Tax=Paenibacillus lautus TaxID=1401 RepID=A0A385TDV8_PAELA|nr:phage head closure protein [Paenibacillus lautus]AYB41793.1 head-tail adaptor protein [Paenibacillus lautus]
MNAGKMRGRITVWHKEKFQNEMKQTDYRDAVFKEVWAEIIPQTGTLQKAQAETLLSSTTHKIIVRYGSGKDIKQDMWITYKEHRFNIKFILNPYFRNAKLEIFAEEVIT